MRRHAFHLNKPLSLIQPRDTSFAFHLKLATFAILDAWFFLEIFNLLRKGKLTVNTRYCTALVVRRQRRHEGHIAYANNGTYNFINTASKLKKERVQQYKKRYKQSRKNTQVVQGRKRDLQFCTKSKPCHGCRLPFAIVGFHQFCTITSKLDGTMKMEVYNLGRKKVICFSKEQMIHLWLHSIKSRQSIMVGCTEAVKYFMSLSHRFAFYQSCIPSIDCLRWKANEFWIVVITICRCKRMCFEQKTMYVCCQGWKLQRLLHWYYWKL